VPLNSIVGREWETGFDRIAQKSSKQYEAVETERRRAEAAGPHGAWKLDFIIKYAAGRRISKAHNIDLDMPAMTEPGREGKSFPKEKRLRKTATRLERAGCSEDSFGKNCRGRNPLMTCHRACAKKTILRHISMRSGAVVRPRVSKATNEMGA